MVSVFLLKRYFLVSMILSTITCTFIQKTKVLLVDKRLLIIYSLLINIIFSIIFCKTFTNITFPDSMWIGLFTFIGSDTLYKSLEGRLSTYQELRKKESTIGVENDKFKYPK